jgi:hypothetical protein
MAYSKAKLRSNGDNGKGKWRRGLEHRNVRILYTASSLKTAGSELPSVT